MEHITVFRDESLYCAFPEIVTLQNGEPRTTALPGPFSQERDSYPLLPVVRGELLVGFREAPRREIISHHDPHSKAVLVRSKDGGKTWSDKTLVYADEDAVQDPSLMQSRDSTVMASFFKWRIRKTREELGELEPKSDISIYKFPEGGWASIVGSFVIRSFDNGWTWEKSPIQVNVPAYKWAATSAPPLECSDGNILLPLYGQPESGLNCSGSNITTIDISLVVKSYDKGNTWTEPTIVGADSQRKIELQEPTLVQLKSGKIICMMRASSGGEDYLRQAESDDGGKSWTDFWKTPIIGHPPHLLQLSDGRVLCTYGYRHKPYGIRACISDDEGKTWDIANEIVLRDDGSNGDLGYPSSVELEAGKILTVYYFHDKTETRFIAGTTFEL